MQIKKINLDVIKIRFEIFMSERNKMYSTKNKVCRKIIENCFAFSYDLRLLLDSLLETTPQIQMLQGISAKTGLQISMGEKKQE